MWSGEMSQRFPKPIKSVPDRSGTGGSNPNLLAAGTTSALLIFAVSIRKYELHELATAETMSTSPCPRGSQQPPDLPLQS